MVATVAEYLDALPADRRAAITRVREVILANLPPGFEEGLEFGMIGYYVPLSRYPDTYNGRPLCIGALASQKQHMAVYLMCVYGDPELARWFAAEWKKTGKKLDLGKSCVRFRSLDDLPLEVIGRTIARVGVDEFLAHYEAARAGTAQGRQRKARAAKPPVKAKVTAKAAKAKAKPAKKTVKPKPKAVKAKPKKRRA